MTQFPYTPVGSDGLPEDDRDDITLVSEQIDAMTTHQRAARRAEVIDELARLDKFERLSSRQTAARSALVEELGAIGAADDADEIKRATLRTRAADPRNVEAGTEDTTRRPNTGRTRRRGGPDPTVLSRARTEAYGDLGESLGVLGSDELLRRHDRVLDALRSSGIPEDGLNKLADLVEEPDAELLGDLYPAAVQQRRHAAAQNLALADPEYLGAFNKILRDPVMGHLDMTDSERHAVSRMRSFQRHLAGDDRDWRTRPMSMGDDGTITTRAALSLTLANGGYMLPLYLDPTILLLNAGAANPWRTWAREVQTTSNTWNGVNSQGVNAAWLAENTIVTDNTPTVGQIQITPAKAAAWVFGSYEVLADTDFANQLPMLLADARNRLESTAFAVGTGSGQPFGAVTRATATAIAGGTITAAGVYSLHQALPARFRAGQQAWFANVAGQDVMRQLPIFASALTPMLQGSTMTPFGETCYEASDVDGVIAVGGHKVLVYGDGSQYIVADRVGMSLIYEPLVKGAGGVLPQGSGGWFAFWRVGADSSAMGTSTAIRNLTLT